MVFHMDVPTGLLSVLQEQQLGTMEHTQEDRHRKWVKSGEAHRTMKEGHSKMTIVVVVSCSSSFHSATVGTDGMIYAKRHDSAESFPLPRPLAPKNPLSHFHRYSKTKQSSPTATLLPAQHYHHQHHSLDSYWTTTKKTRPTPVEAKHPHSPRCHYSFRSSNLMATATTTPTPSCRPQNWTAENQVESELSWLWKWRIVENANYLKTKQQHSPRK